MAIETSLKNENNEEEEKKHDDDVHFVRWIDLVYRNLVMNEILKIKIDRRM